MHRAALAITLAPMILTGCYASHGLGDGGLSIDAQVARRDAGNEPDATGPSLDAGTDAPEPSDASCVRIDERSVRFCVLTPTGAIPAAETYFLRIERSMCLCESRTCATRVSGRRIELTTETCDLDIVCDECTSEQECVIPPLEEGSYDVLVDGVFSGTVRAAPRRMVMDAQPACWAIPDAPDDSLLCAGNVVERSSGGQICHRTLEDVGTFVSFDVTFDCGGCFDWSAGCEAIRESARSVLVRPRLQACECPTCGACAPDVCVPQTVRCQTPALRDGSYDVTVEREDGTRHVASSLRVEDVDVPGPSVCAPLP
jgi:hypothetical protein